MMFFLTQRWCIVLDSYFLASVAFAAYRSDIKSPFGVFGSRINDPNISLMRCIACDTE